MIIGYLIGATTFAGLCSLVWMLLGGSFLGAVLAYLVGGQVAILTLIGFALFRASRRTTA